MGLQSCRLVSSTQCIKRKEQESADRTYSAVASRESVCVPTAQRNLMSAMVQINIKGKFETLIK